MASIPRATGRVPALPSARGLSRTLLAGIALLIVAVVGLFQVLQTSRATTAGYELRSLERERAVLAAEVRILEADVAQQARVEEVRAAAIERLGMVKPEATVQITVPVQAPAVLALPERYVNRPDPVPPVELAWWERLLQKVPGFQ